MIYPVSCSCGWRRKAWTRWGAVRLCRKHSHSHVRLALR